MNLLNEGIKQETVIKTTLTKKLTIDGLTKAYPVYKIDLNWLFYNDQNDRISTWISQYQAQERKVVSEIVDKNKYNNLIEEFIIESNPEAFKKTKTNIELVEQREPGVVLNDGRIVDGNRRFTCLRRLSKENEKYKYFEAVILDKNIESSAKEIKMLELSIQHGEENKVDYNPIDRLVGVYNDIICTNLLSEEEYAASTNETLWEVKKKIEIAHLMIEYLCFINAQEQFHLARIMQIYYPLDELSKLIKKCENIEKVEKLKYIVFTNIFLKTSSDMTRFVRNLNNILGSEFQTDFLTEQYLFSLQLKESLPSLMNLDTKEINEVIRTNNELEQSIEHSVDMNLTKVKKNEVKNRPFQLVEKANAFLETIDTNIFIKMNVQEIAQLKKELDKLGCSLQKIHSCL